MAATSARSLVTTNAIRCPAAASFKWVEAVAQEGDGQRTFICDSVKSCTLTEAPELGGWPMPAARCPMRAVGRLDAPLVVTHATYLRRMGGEVFYFLDRNPRGR